MNAAAPAQPLRVLQLCKFFPPHPGGMETVVFELAEAMSRRGVEVEVMCSSTSARTVRERGPAGYPVTRAASLGKVLGVSISPRLLDLARSAIARADIVHVHMPDPLTALALRLYPPRGRLVVHWHSDVVRQRLAMSLYRPLQAWLLRRCDVIVATSPTYASASPWLRPWQRKTDVIPIGISDPDPAPPAAVEALRRRYGGRRIVFSLGRMSAYKGFEVLIDAAARLPADVVVVVGGAGELLARHRREVASRGLGKRIEFLGHVAAPELPAWFEAASLFVLPSVQRSEAFGVVMIEAMARSKPVVATKIEGSGVSFVNVDGETGINVRPGDAADLAGAIAELVEDDAAMFRLGAAGRRRFLAHFQASRMIDAMLRTYCR